MYWNDPVPSKTSSSSHKLNKSDSVKTSGSRIMYSSSEYTLSRRQASCIQAVPPYGTRPKVVKLLARVHTTHSTLHCVLCTHTSSTRSRFDDYWMDFCFPAGLVHGKRVENWKKISHTECVYTVQTVQCVVCTHTSSTRSRLDDFWIEFCFPAGLMQGNKSKI